MTQRTSEWLEKVDLKYHERQFHDPYRSTVLFCDWLEERGYISPDSRLTVIDIACGQGANIYYMGSRYPGCTFVGVDLNPDIVHSGNRFFKEHNIPNCKLIQGDLYDLDVSSLPPCDGLISLQALSWFPEYLKPLEAMAGLNAKWMALSSLFYEGPVSCTIKMQDYDQELFPALESFYNVYSIPVVQKSWSDLGYGKFQATPFEIDIDLPKPEVLGRGTYTEQLQNGKRVQISGPIMMPWYFLVASRMKSDVT